MLLVWKALKILSIGIMILLLIAVGVVVFFPAPIIQAVSNVVSSKTDFKFEPGRVSGNLVTGIKFHDLTLSAPQADVSIAQLNIRLRLLKLLRRDIVFRSIVIDEPRVVLKPSEKETKEKKTSEKSAWELIARNVEIKNGLVEIRNEDPEKVLVVSNINIESSFQNNEVTVESARASAKESTVTIKGTVWLAPLSVDVVAQTAGLFDGQLKVAGSTTDANVDVDGRWKGARVAGQANLKKESWNADLSFSDLDPRVISSSASVQIGMISGQLQARGDGFKPDIMTVETIFSLTSSRGPKVKGDATLKKGKGRWNVEIVEGGVTGTTKGTFTSPQVVLNASWDLSVSSVAVQQWTGAASSQIHSQGSIRGSLAAAKWKTKTDFSEVKVNSVDILRGALIAEGRGVPPKMLSATLTADRIQVASQTFDNASVSVIGSTNTHQLELTVNSTDYSLLAKGVGHLNGKVWKANWTTFDVHAIQNWKLAHPFFLSIGPRLVQISDLELIDLPARFKGDLLLRDEVFERGEVSASAFELENLFKTHFVKVPIKGTAQVAAQIRGEMKNPQGTATFSLVNLGIDNESVGNLEGKGQFSKEKIVLEYVNLTAATGTASIAGTVEIADKRNVIPEFDLKIKANGLDLQPLLKSSPMKMKTSRLNANLHITHAENEFQAMGPLTLTAVEAQYPQKGVLLKDLILDLEGTGSTLKVKNGSALSGGKKKKGKVELTGVVGLNSVDIELSAQNFSFDTDLGVSGRINLQVALKGSLDEPRVVGDIEILTADIMPDKKKKMSKEEEEKEKQAKAKQPKEEAPSNLSLNIRVHFANDVWYKEKQTAIELKGDFSVKKRPYEPTFIFGTVETVRGDYIFYGRDFKIESGQVTFTGDPKTDSILNVTALYVEAVSKTKIYLTITGSLDQPVLALTSDPPLEQTDIVSILLTGRPLDDAGNANTDSQAVAKAMVANYFAEKVRQELQGTIQVDVLRFKVSDTEDADLTVGKNVSHRLYVAYGQTLGPNGEKRVEAQYSLGHFWSLEGTTSSEGKYVIDLLYRLGLP